MKWVDKEKEQVMIGGCAILEKLGRVQWHLSLEEDRSSLKKYPMFLPDYAPINVSGHTYTHMPTLFPL